MADARTRAAEFKAKGNAAFSAKQFDEAIQWFSKAIEQDPSDHVFFSNRSACYLSKNDADSALTDAEECVRLAPAWAKGYSREGAALHALGRLHDAVESFQKGLDLEPDNDALKTGHASALRALAAAQQQRQSNPLSALSQMFGPQLLPQLLSNPKFAEYLKDPSFVAMLRDVQGDPNKLGQYISDPRMLEVLSTVMGVQVQRAGEGGSMDEERAGDNDTQDAEEAAGTTAGGAWAEEKQDAVPEVEETEEEKAERLEREAATREQQERTRRAEALKAEGNKLYQAKRLDEAIAKYNEALEVDPSNATYLNNRAAAEAEKGLTDVALATCEQALTLAKEQHSAFEVKAKILARRGNLLCKLNRLEEAIQSYRDSLLEAHDKAVEKKLKQTIQQKKVAEDAAYLDPAKAVEAKERGNELFKNGDFPGALREYSEAIMRDPKNPVYYSNRAAAYTKLIDFGKALADCEKALDMDPKFVKAWGRRGNAEFFLKKYHKAMDSFRAGLAIDPSDATCTEGMQRTIAKINESSSTDDPERAARAMEDPEIQAILRDPVFSQVLNDLKTSPASAQKHLSDPGIAAKLEKLIAAGVLKMG